MSSLPLVSIVTPSFNQGEFLAETIRSVLQQDYPSIEYVIVDGGSTDDSVDIIRRHSSQLAYWVSEPDQGQADAINKGWRLCKGEILAWLNSDDSYEPGAVKAAVAAFTEHPEANLVYGDMNFIDGQGRVLYTHRAPDFDLRTFIGECCYIRQPTAFMRRVAVNEVGMLGISWNYVMDYDLFIRICSRFPVQRIPQVMANFRLHAASKTMSDSAHHSDHTFWPEERTLLEGVATGRDFSAEIRALAWRRVGAHYCDRRNMPLAREMMARAIAAYPPVLFDPATISVCLKALLGRRAMNAYTAVRGKLVKDFG